MNRGYLRAMRWMFFAAMLCGAGGFSWAGGRFVVHEQLGVQGLLDRKVTVWLPDRYDSNPEERFGVLYLHDGQNVFDPARSSFGTEWAADEAVEALMASGELPAMIVVGVDNTSHRREEYAPGPVGDAYRDWFAGALREFIDATYRTRTAPADRWVGGASMGGLVSFMLAWEHPELYGAAICMSPAFKYLNFDYPAGLEGPAPACTHFYIDNGTEALEAELQPGVDAMVARLPELGCREDTCFTLFIEQGARHFEADWARRLPGALRNCQWFTAATRSEPGPCIR